MSVIESNVSNKFAAFKQTVTTTPAKLAIPSGFVCKRDSILKLNINATKQVWVGDSDVTVGTGFPLDPGDKIPIAIDNLSHVFVVADTTSQDIYVWAE